MSALAIRSGVVGRCLRAAGIRPRSRASDPRAPAIAGYSRHISRRRGRALLCYLPEAFALDPDSDAFLEHQNLQRCVEMANSLNRVGYEVDVVGCFDGSFVPANPYDVLIGAESTFARMADVLGVATRKVYLSPGPWRPVTVLEEQRRLDDLERRRGVRLDTRLPRGVAPRMDRVDAVVTTGDSSWLASSFPDCRGGVHCVGDGGFDFLDGPSGDRESSVSKTRFMWMASWLNVLKGLDLVLEVFAGLPDLELYVCGPIWNEPDFVTEYERELFHLPNVHVMGTLRLRSAEFRALASRVGYTIFPTGGDAAPGSVWAPMKLGVVPIVSIEAGMDVDGFGMLLPECTPSAIQTAVVRAAELPASDYGELVDAAVNSGQHQYTMPAWVFRFEAILRQVLDGEPAHG